MIYLRRIIVKLTIPIILMCLNYIITEQNWIVP